MGNYKFRLSNMMPNAWFYKLKGMSRTRKHHQSFHSLKKKQSSEASASRKLHDSHQRYPHYLTTEPTGPNRFHSSPIHPKALDTSFPDTSPRKSSNKKRNKRKTIYRPSPKLKLSSSVSSGCRCHASVSSSRTNNNKSSLINPEPSDNSLSEVGSSFEFLSSESDGDGDGNGIVPPANSFDDCEPISRPHSADFVIHMKSDRYRRKFKDVNGFDSISEVEDRLTSKQLEETTQAGTQVKDFEKDESLSVVKEKPVEKQSQQKPISVGRKSNASPAGIKLRVNSPKIARKKMQSSARNSISSSNAGTRLESKNKGISDSFAIVMSSVDPEKDFRKSMVEMIVENNIRESKDLEDLLACYLLLNSSEYHDIIIKAFEQTWFDMTNLRL